MTDLEKEYQTLRSEYLQITKRKEEIEIQMYTLLGLGIIDPSRIEMEKNILEFILPKNKE